MLRSLAPTGYRQQGFFPLPIEERLSWKSRRRTVQRAICLLGAMRMIIFKKTQTAEPAPVAATPTVDPKAPAEETASVKPKKSGSNSRSGGKRPKTDDNRLL